MHRLNAKSTVTLARTAFVALLAALFSTGQGCAPVVRDEPASYLRDPWAEPDWGTPAEGLQCRLKPLRRTWQTGQVPVFMLDIRNSGRRTFALPRENLSRLFSLQLDNTWYYPPEPALLDTTMVHLAPETESTDIPLALDDQAARIPLPPGRHVVRVAVPLEGIRVLSNPVGIEVTTGPGR